MYSTRSVALLCTLPLAAKKAQETSPPKYDVHTEIKMKGTVEEVKLPPKGSEKEVAHLLVKSGTDTADVYLGPKSLLDEIVLTGSKVKQGEADLILAREVVKGTDTLVLRDEERQSRLELAPLSVPKYRIPIVTSPIQEIRECLQVSNSRVAALALVSGGTCSSASLPEQ